MKHEKNEVIAMAKNIFTSLDLNDYYVKETMTAKYFEDNEEIEEPYWMVHSEVLTQYLGANHRDVIILLVTDIDLEPFKYYPEATGHPNNPLKISKKENTYFFDGEWIEEE